MIFYEGGVSSRTTFPTLQIPPSIIYHYNQHPEPNILRQEFRYFCGTRDFFVCTFFALVLAGADEDRSKHVNDKVSCETNILHALLEIRQRTIATRHLRI